MSRIIQPSVAKRLTFAKWARLAGLNRHSSATWTVPDGIDVPESLMAGAQVNGKPYEEPTAPKRTRVRKRKDIGPIEEPIAPAPTPDIEPEPEIEVFTEPPQTEDTQEDD